MPIEEINPFLKGKLPKPVIDFKTKIINSIDFLQFFTEHVEGFSFHANQNCPFPNHQDKTPSFRAKEDGSYKCYGCDKSGSNIIQFWIHKNSYSDQEFSKAQNELYEKYVVPTTINRTLVNSYKKNLKEDQASLNFLQLTRGWKSEIIEYFDLGITTKNDTKLLTIPIKDEYGFLCSILYYNFTHTDRIPKFLYHTEGENSQKIYGLEAVETSSKIYIFEGQPDWLLALSLGYPAITFGSATAWKDSWIEVLKNMDIIICYDTDEAGIRGKDLITNKLLLEAKSIKIINLPKVKDFSEFLMENQFKKVAFDAIVNNTEYFKLPSAPPIKNDSTIDITSAEEISLSKAGNAEYFGKKLKVIALVAGKEPAPLLIPRKVQMTCRDNPTTTKCVNCALAKMPSFSQIFDIEETFKDILQWVVSPSKDHSKIYRAALSVNTKCKVDITVAKMWNLEKVILNSPVRFGKYNDLPERRIGYYLGTGLIPNRHYIFTMYTLQHPIDNSAVHLIVHAEPLDTELEDFKLTDELRDNIKVFQTREIDEKFLEIYDIYAKNVTRIWGRPLLHLAVDLPFFSPNQFTFAEEDVKRAALDIIIYGDQRCGKGKIAEGLSEYYRFGEVLSGENTSFMNLVGGIESGDNFRGLKWGRIVANHGGVIIIDEASALQVETIGKLSRIRSEGIAELDKLGIHAKALARCSLIWLSNPRNDSLSNFNFGIEALKDLIGATEDVARFDYAVAVRTNEVEAEVINRSVDKVTDPYGSHLHRSLILWCKTRKPEQIEFFPESIDTIYSSATALGNEYSATIPLIQTENIRIKLAKISAAIAGRLFSTDETMQKLIILPIHVMKAVSFLREVYEKTPIAYKAYSEMIRLNTNIDPLQIDIIFKPWEVYKIMQDVYNGLLKIRDINAGDFQDMTGGKINFYDAKQIISSLVKAGALQKISNTYRKTTAFISLIKTKLTDPASL